MRHYNPIIVSLVILLLAACAVTPRVSSWEGPKRITKQAVFQAALQAGTENGWQTTSSDRDSGTMSFAHRVGKGQMVLNVSISKPGDVVIVRTTANYGGDLAIKGLHEEFIRNFHVMLFRKLNITEASEKLVKIEHRS